VVYGSRQLPQFAYSFKGFDPAIHVRASGREVNISPKAAREICNTVRMMTLTKAIALLESVEEMKSPIPFRRHKLKVGHRSELVGFPSGSYPVKPAKVILPILRNLQANCEFKGLDPDRVHLIHSSALAGRVLKDYVPRAHGSSSPNFHTLVHIEFVGREL
jgi:large subunit ribosomal protein L22